MLLAPLVSAALACAAPSPAGAVEVWTAVATEKIRPSTAARQGPSAAISAARNEFEAFQIVVTGPATGVRAKASALTGAGTISEVRLYREALLNLTQPSALDGGTGPWPDPLVPDVDELVGQQRNAFPFDVPAGQSRAIWVEVFVPAGAAPGAYTGAVDVTWTGGSAKVPVALTVRRFTLPATASLRSAFSFNWGAIPSEHGVSSGDAFAQLRVRYGNMALDHRVTLSRVDDGDASMPHYDQWYGPSMDGGGATRLGGAEMTAVELMGPASSWSSHFQSKGWLPRLFQYTCDEPPLTCAWSDIPTRAATARAANVKTLVTTSIDESDKHGVTSSIDVMVPCINFMDDKPGSGSAGDQRPKYDGFLAGSAQRELWGYQSCMSHGCGGTVNMGSPNEEDRYFTGWPSYMIDASAVRNRAMQWLLFTFRMTGELYWDTAYAYGQDPWNSVYQFSGNGDGTLFYPGQTSRIGGTTDIPIASMRLKYIREGMEDYEYLKLLASAGDEAMARREALTLFPHPYSTEQKPEDLMAARERIAARIEALAGGTPTPTPDPGPGPTPTPDPTPSPDPVTETPTVQRGRGGCTSAGETTLLALYGAVIALLPARRRPRA
ncbi:MAG: DUF4091 domain-containing protein [Anaeromyxobacteraceae bacterium]